MKLWDVGFWESGPEGIWAFGNMGLWEYGSEELGLKTGSDKDCKKRMNNELPEQISCPGRYCFKL